MRSTERESEYRQLLATMLGTEQLPLDDPKRAATARECEWLRIVYETHRDHIQGDLDRGWTVLQLFVPLSLAPFAGIVLLSNIRAGHVLVLAAASLTLLVAANVFVDRITQHEGMMWEIAQAIEREIGLPNLWARQVEIHQSNGPRLKHIRWALVVLVAILWLLLSIAVAVGLLDAVSAAP